MMSKDKKKAILVVSFGTSHNDTRKVTIDAIEDEIRQAFPDYPVYRAWTSRRIISLLQKRDGVHIDTVDEAMQQMREDGIQEVVVQPTHVINGIENDQMKEDVLAYSKDFQRISFGTPLLTSEEDSDAVIDAIGQESQNLNPDASLVLMGHGSPHYANSVYAYLDYKFKDKGYPNIFVGTVESYPPLEALFRQVERTGIKRVVLAPLMIVAGDHAKNDMAGKDPDSWYSQFCKAGYDVECLVKGLGEYPAIRARFVEHIRQAVPCTVAAK